jgi:hypothetical protein
MVSYVLGAAKKTSRKDRIPNRGLRKISSRSTTPTETAPNVDGHSSSIKQANGNAVSSAAAALPVPSKQTKKGLLVPSFRSMFSCLKPHDQEEMLRASRRGFVSLEGLSYGTGRTRGRLASAHRQWCDERGKPQIVHCKAVHDDQLDCVIVDLSPLRVTTAVMGAEYDVNDFLVRWKAQIVTAAARTGMDLKKRDNLESINCERLSTLDDEDLDMECDDENYDDECAILFEEEDFEQDGSSDSAISMAYEGSVEYVIEVPEEDPWTKQPISRLPVLTMGVFEGRRSDAKAMAKELAMLWEIPEEVENLELTSRPNSINSDAGSSNSSKGARQRRDRKRENRRKRRNSRDNLDLYMF